VASREARPFLVDPTSSLAPPTARAVMPQETPSQPARLRRSMGLTHALLRWPIQHRWRRLHSYFQTPPIFRVIPNALGSPRRRLSVCLVHPMRTLVQVMMASAAHAIREHAWCDLPLPWQQRARAMLVALTAGDSGRVLPDTMHQLCQLSRDQRRGQRPPLRCNGRYH
jgi:hypothetical protein